MKKNIICFLIFFQATLNYSQEKKDFECIYTVYTSVDLDADLKKNQISELILKSKPLEYRLTVLAGNAYYSESNSLITDGLEAQEQSTKVRRIVSSGNVEHVIGDLNTGEIKQWLNISQGVFCINTFMNEINWEITTETKTIDRYLCYKAKSNIASIDKHGNVVKNEVIAYFTPIIPFQAGPLGYYGLPGLIIELQDKSKTIQLKSISFEKIKDFKVPKEIKCDKSFNSKIEYEKFLYDERKKI